MLRRLTRTSLASERPQQTGPCGAGFMPNALLSTSASTPSANLGTRPDMADGALLRPSRARLMANEAGRAASSGPSASDGPTRHEILKRTNVRVNKFYFKWGKASIGRFWRFSRGYVSTGGPTASRTCENWRVPGAGAAPNLDEASGSGPETRGSGCFRALNTQFSGL